MAAIVFFVVKAKKGKTVSAPAVKRAPVKEQTRADDNSGDNSDNNSGDAFDFDNEVASTSKKQSVEDPFLTDDDK